jgi:hypothetical protein
MLKVLHLLERVDNQYSDGYEISGARARIPAMSRAQGSCLVLGAVATHSLRVHTCITHCDTTRLYNVNVVSDRSRSPAS